MPFAPVGAGVPTVSVLVGEPTGETLPWALGAPTKSKSGHIPTMRIFVSSLPPSAHNPAYGRISQEIPKLPQCRVPLLQVLVFRCVGELVFYRY